MKLLLIDWSNILLRCAFGGEIPPEQSTPTAIGMVSRAARELDATHLVLALDYTDAPSWRKREHPEYKAHRTVNTALWLIEGAAQASRQGWHVSWSPGFEADDVIATVAVRSIERAGVVVLSNDSDLLPLTASGVDVVKPVTGGGFQQMTAEQVCAKYKIPRAELLSDFKAMTGESGDNIPGVPSIGPKRASDLLARFPDGLEEIIAAGATGFDKYSTIVHQHADIARRALRLVTLRTDAPVAPIAPRLCSIDAARAA